MWWVGSWVWVSGGDVEGEVEVRCWRMGCGFVVRVRERRRILFGL